MTTNFENTITFFFPFGKIKYYQLHFFLPIYETRGVACDFTMVSEKINKQPHES